MKSLFAMSLLDIPATASRRFRAAVRSADGRSGSATQACSGHRIRRTAPARSRRRTADAGATDSARRPPPPARPHRPPSPCRRAPDIRSTPQQTFTVLGRERFGMARNGIRQRQRQLVGELASPVRHGGVAPLRCHLQADQLMGRLTTVAGLRGGVADGRHRVGQISACRQCPSGRDREGGVHVHVGVRHVRRASSRAAFASADWPSLACASVSAKQVAGRKPVVMP